MYHRIIVAFASAAAIGGLLGVAAPEQVSMHHSCGYHCTLDGTASTPSAPESPSVQPVGRTNVHSGGRLHGSANKRVGCGGCPGHPASYVVIPGGKVQLAGRTNVHSDGRAAGKALPRRGAPIGRGIGKYAIHKV